jgi:hypothetical protein
LSRRLFARRAWLYRAVTSTARSPCQRLELNPDPPGRWLRRASPIAAARHESIFAGFACSAPAPRRSLE